MQGQCKKERFMVITIIIIIIIITIILLWLLPTCDSFASVFIGAHFIRIPAYTEDQMKQPAMYD